MAQKRSEVEWETWKFPHERDLQTFVLKKLKHPRHKMHIRVVKVVLANESGVSDLLLCVDGLFVAIELKVGSNKPTELQKKFLQDVLMAGGRSGVAYTWREVKDIILKVGYDIGEE